MDDPVRARRAMARKWAKQAKRSGFVAYLAAIVVFVLAFPGGFDGISVPVVVVLLALGSALILPATVVGYGVNAAEREDRQLGR